MQPVRCRPLHGSVAMAARMLRGRVLRDGQTISAARHSPPVVLLIVTADPSVISAVIDTEANATWNTTIVSGSVKAGHREMMMAIAPEGDAVVATNAGGTTEVLCGDIFYADQFHYLVHVTAYQGFNP